MKREGLQHGTVRINRNKLLRIADADAEAAAVVGVFGKAPSKPTNASKSTGKCRRARCASCYQHHVSKARDKAKGSHKLRACDVALNHRLLSWRIVDDETAGIPDYKGASATAVLAYLAGGSSSWHEDDNGGGILHNPAHRAVSDVYDFIVGHQGGAPAEEAEETDSANANDIPVEEQQQEEEDMGFCMVGIAIAVEYSDGEDWIIVEEI